MAPRAASCSAPLVRLRGSHRPGGLARRPARSLVLLIEGGDAATASFVTEDGLVVPSCVESRVTLARFAVRSWLLWCPSLRECWAAVRSGRGALVPAGQAERVAWSFASMYLAGKSLVLVEVEREWCWLDVSEVC